MKTIKLTLALSVLALIWNSTASAQNGTIGETVSTNTDITLEINPLVKVDDVATDVDLGQFTGNAAISSPWDNICVATNLSTPLYTVTVTGLGSEGTAGLLLETADNTDTIAYTVSYADAINGGGTVATPAHNGTTDAITTGHDTLAECAGAGVGDNASVRVSVALNAMRAVHSAIYTGTLTLRFDPA